MKQIIYLCLLIPCISIASSHFVNIIDNSDQAIYVNVITTKIGWLNPSTATSQCNHQTLPGALCKLTLSDGWRSNLTEGNAGTIIISAADGSTCKANFDYTLNPLSIAAIKDSESFTQLQCTGALAQYNFTYINPVFLKSIRHLDDFTDSAESQALEDCGAEATMNCLVLSPPTHDVLKSLTLQDQLDQYEPLNTEQFIGGHNSAVSRSYTNSTLLSNLSYSDPNAAENLINQLNQGVRQIELDIEWDKPTHKLIICHDHVSNLPITQDALCDNNQSLSGSTNSPLNQIAIWAKAHPNDLLFIYFDVNEPIDGHFDLFNQEIASTIGPMVLQPKTYLQTSQLSAYLITHFYHKNLILTNDDGNNGKPDLSPSPWVFTKATLNQQPPLPEMGVDNLINAKIDCRDNTNKYNQLNHLYKHPNHFHLLRLNADRTAIEYIEHQKANYFTTLNLSNYRACPVNIYGLNMLGATPNNTLDPRLASLIWSWQPGYPVNNGATIAQINPSNWHFENQPLKINQTYYALCYKKTAIQSPTTALQWFTIQIAFSKTKLAYDLPNKACHYAGGYFATPVTSYWMDDVVSMLKNNNVNAPVLINLIDANNQWVVNNKSSLLLR